MMTPNSQTATLIRAYVQNQITDNFGEDETPPAILTAVCDALTADETCHLGRALLARAHTLSDPAYRIGGEMCDPRLVEIATRLGWTP